VALSSRSPALGVTQQVWSFGSPDFPQIRSKKRIRNHLRLLFPSSSLVANQPKLLAIDSYIDKSVANQLMRFRILVIALARLLVPNCYYAGLPQVLLRLSRFKSKGNCSFQA